MLGSEHYIGRAIKRVGAGGENPNFVAAVAGRGAGVIDSGYSKVDFRAFAAPNPVALKQFDSLGPIESVQFLQ